MRLSFLTLLLSCCFHIALWGQNEPLDWNQLRQQILLYHPGAINAAIFNNMAQAELLQSRGGFDLKTYADFTGKQFDNKSYFQYTEAGLKLPTWYGLEFKTAYNWASGSFINPQNGLPEIGQASFGLNWTLLQGLMMDQRRADLQIARIGLLAGNADRDALLNELMFAAAKAYWTWSVADNQLLVIQDALQQAETRHIAIVESFRQGERSAMDSLETFIQVQNRRLELNDSRIALQLATLDLNNYRWDANRNILPITTIGVAPRLMLNLPTPANAISDVNELAAKHPLVNLYRLKVQQLQVERRLKREQLKPVLNAEYFLLGNGWQFFPTAGEGAPGVLAQDVKYGLNFSYPIPNRKARGAVQIADLKIDQNQAFLLQKQQEIAVKIGQYNNEQLILTQQIRLYADVTSQYRQLLDFEIERFRNGESSIFLVNTREQRWLDAQIKYLKLLGEYRKVEAGLLWAQGGF
jgi:outer membrane protein TolC